MLEFQASTRHVGLSENAGSNADLENYTEPCFTVSPGPRSVDWQVLYLLDSTWRFMGSYK